MISKFLKSAAIAKLALITDMYHLYCKYAGVIEDMADRVFFSLTTKLSDPVEASRFNTE